jgi:hypothetical protein
MDEQKSACGEADEQPAQVAGLVVHPADLWNEGSRFGHQGPPLPSCGALL